MSAAELGPFSQGFAMWRRIIEQAPPEAHLKVFVNAAEEVATFVARGLDPIAAADELTDIALGVGLEDFDALQSIVAHTFEKVAKDIERTNDYSKYDAEQQKTNGHAEAPPRQATRYTAPDPQAIPKRAWLYGGHYIRQTASATFAPGGFGKTTLQLFEALEMVKAGFKVWYLSGEDPRAELDRRIAAHCLQHNVVVADLPGLLFVDDRASFALSVAKSPRAGVVIFDEASLGEFEHAIVADQIDAVILDPFVAFHTVAENDNTSIDLVVKRLAAIAMRTNSAIEISHHVRKGSTVGAGFRAELTVDDARGGSSIVNAVRSARVINRMSATEGEQAKVEKAKRSLHVRVDIGKRNMAPPPDKAAWFQLSGVHIANGDFVQALVPWTFPGLMDDLSVEDTEHIRDLVRQRNFRADSRSPEWLGLEVAKRMKLNALDTGDIKKIQRIIGIWLRNGVFRKVEMRDGDSRKKFMFYTAPAPQAEPDNVVRLFPAGDDDDRHPDLIED